MKATEVKTKEDWIEYQAELINELYDKEKQLLGQIRILLKRLVDEGK